jgi:hypothetical protein
MPLVRSRQTCAGQIGGTLTRRLRALGHEVHVANSRDPRTLPSLVTETGAVAVEAKDAPRGVDLVIVTIPERNVPTLPKGLFAGVAASVVVVDTGNYYPRQRDGQIVEIESGMPESRWVEQKLGRPVIKAFNNIYARHLLERGRPRGSPGRIALPVAGDDAKAKAVVLQLVDELGFDAVDAGGLDDSWRQQPGTPVYTTDLDAEGVRKALSAARRQRTPDWTATPKAPATLPIRRKEGCVSRVGGLAKAATTLAVLLVFATASAVLTDAMIGRTITGHSPKAGSKISSGRTG